MNYKIIYSNSSKNYNNPVGMRTLYNMGDWRSRWERKRDLDRPKGFFINRIFTKPTDKDYIFTHAYGYDNNIKMHFKIVPDNSVVKPVQPSCGFNQNKRCRDVNSKRYGKSCRYK